MKRSRPIFLIAALACIPLGLATRSDLILSSVPFNSIKSHGGDVIWALMVYFGFRFLFIRQSILIVAAISFSFAAAIECSQLIDSKSFDLIRDNTLGRLIFGRGFLWIDFLRYAIGIAIGAILEAIFVRRSPSE